MNNSKGFEDNIGSGVLKTPGVNVVVTQFELTKALYTSGLLAKVELTGTTKLFLWALCTHYNPQKESMFPSQATVAKKLGVSEKSAERAVKELKIKGLVEYETKYVNHYRFSGKFFELLGFFNTQDKMSERYRQNVGERYRQNVGLTNNTKQIKNNKNFNYFKDNSENSGGKAVPGVEETQKLLEERERIRNEDFNPLDYSREEAQEWIESIPEFWLKKSKIARFLIEKYKFEDFLYTLDFPIESFPERT